MAYVASLDFSGRLGEVFQRTLPKLEPSARDQLAAIIEPTSLKIIAGLLTAWFIGHAFGAGEAIDIIFQFVALSLFRGGAGADHRSRRKDRL
jgi:hypothetical protein